MGLLALLSISGDGNGHIVPMSPRCSLRLSLYVKLQPFCDIWRDISYLLERIIGVYRKLYTFWEFPPAPRCRWKPAKLRVSGEHYPFSSLASNMITVTSDLFLLWTFDTVWKQLSHGRENGGFGYWLPCDARCEYNENRTWRLNLHDRIMMILLYNQMY